MTRKFLSKVVPLIAGAALLHLFLSLADVREAKAFTSALVGKGAPEFTQTDADDWINSEPLTIAALRGEVVLIDFWTFGCWNCYRSFPWLNTLQQRYESRGLKIVGVHSPEFDHEKDRVKVKEKVAAFKLDHPVMIDNDFNYWRAMQNRYWPTFYLLDKAGVVRAVFVGETHEGDARAEKIATAIETLLDEPG